WVLPRLATLGGVTALAAVALIAIALGWRVDRPVLSGPGGPVPTAGPSVFDPTIEGQGLIAVIWPTLELVGLGGAGAAGLCSARAGWGWWRNRRRRELVATLLPLAIVVGFVAVAKEPGFEWRGGAYGAAAGIAVTVDAPPGSGGVTAFYITAPPG